MYARLEQIWETRDPVELGLQAIALTALGSFVVSPIFVTERAERVARIVETEWELAGLTGGDASANVACRVRGYGRAQTTVNATLFGNGYTDHVGVADGDAGATGSPNIVLGNSVTAAFTCAQHAKSLGGLSLGMLGKLDPKIVVGIVKTGGAAFTGGTITLKRLTLYG